MKRISTAVVALALVASIMGCTTMVRIETLPKGAEVYINNEAVGKTPVSTELSDFAFTDYQVRIVKEGYDTYVGRLGKEFKPVTFVAGLLLFWPSLLWIYGPMEHQYFELAEE